MAKCTVSLVLVVKILFRQKLNSLQIKMLHSKKLETQIIFLDNFIILALVTFMFLMIFI